jgi:uridylate kinase
MGMLGGVINGQALMDIFQHKGLPTRVMSSIRMEQICEPYVRRKAIRHLEKGRVVIASGGTGRPYVTHDSAGVFYGLELDCEVMVKGSNVDGIYDKDPNKFDDAKHLATISFQKALESQAIKVMDKAAIGMALEHKLPIIVYNVNEEGSLLKIANGETIGTTVS